MAEFVTPGMVRDYLTIDGTTGQWSDALIGSNIAAASANLQRWTNRQFEPQGSNTAVTKRFSTRGRTYITIPDLRSGTVTLNGSDMTDGTTVYLIPDRMAQNVYTAIQIPGHREPGNYRSYRDWFDRNLDSWRFSGRAEIPNDLSITGVWGHAPYPDSLLHATKVLAAYYTKRPDAVLGGVSQTAQGNEVDLSQLPREVADFIRDWKLEDYY